MYLCVCLWVSICTCVYVWMCLFVCVSVSPHWLGLKQRYYYLQLHIYFSIFKVIIYFIFYMYKPVDLWKLSSTSRSAEVGSSCCRASSVSMSRMIANCWVGLSGRLGGSFPALTTQDIPESTENTQPTSSHFTNITSISTTTNYI